MGNLVQAAAHSEDALALCQKGYQPELAWTCCDYADTLLQCANPGGREQAMSLLYEPLATPRQARNAARDGAGVSRRDILKA